jgi:hypothetical protein
VWVALAASSARAQGRELAAPFAPAEAPDVSLDLHAGTLVPFLVGGGMRVGLPGQLVFGVLAGATPNVYADVFGGAADAYGAPSGIGELVSSYFGGAFALRVEAGVRPVPHAGLELIAHYTALLASPAVSAAAIAQIAGQPIAWPGLTSIRVDGALHGFGGELAWAFEPVDALVLRLSLGLTWFAAAGIRLDVPQEMRTAGGAIEQAEARVAAAFTTYGVVPYVGVLAGWRIE